MLMCRRRPRLVEQQVEARTPGRLRKRERDVGFTRMKEDPHVRGCSGHRSKPKAPHAVGFGFKSVSSAEGAEGAVSCRPLARCD